MENILGILIYFVNALIKKKTLNATFFTKFILFFIDLLDQYSARRNPTQEGSFNRINPLTI